jgi:Mg2+/Co2+ transporter CorB
MVHRTRMTALDAGQPRQDLITAILESPYTRIPMWRGNPDNIIGVIHAKDVLRALIKSDGDITGLDIASIMVKPWFVPESTSVPAQLAAFLRSKTHFALIVDEYGEVEGLLTLEDILEEIVGDIADEHDEVMEGARKQSDGSFLVDGSLPIRDLNRALGWELPEDDATTIAGLVLHEAKMIPDVNQSFLFHGFRFRVTRKDRNRITELRISR